MKYQIWIEDSGEWLQEFTRNDEARRKFNEVFGLNVPPVYDFTLMRGDVYEGFFPVTGEYIRFHFDWDAWFETDDEETARYLGIYFTVWAKGGECIFSDEENLLWLTRKLREASEE